MTTVDKVSLAKSIKYDDIIRRTRIELLTDFEERCMKSPNRKKSDIAKEMNYSVATINRYKKELGYTSNRKVPARTQEEKQQIALKGLQTRIRNEEFRSRRSELYDKYKDGSMTFDEFDSQISELSGKLKVRLPERQGTSTGENPVTSRNGVHKASQERSRGMRAGTLKTAEPDSDDEPRTITEEEAERRMAALAQRNQTRVPQKSNVQSATADSLIQNSIDRLAGKLN